MSKIPVNLDPREEKKHIAAGIRERLNERRILTVNLISSPGSGKTTLLEQVLPGLSKELRLAVIEADNATRNDADRLEASGLTVEMIANAITGCHISPAGALKAFDALDLDNLELVVIENVGNLVCPSGVDLGEDHKIAMVSVTEGEDKPLKYPLLFQKSSLALINKIDAAEALGADVDALEANILATNPHIEVLRLSARTRENLDGFVTWIKNKVHEKQNSQKGFK
ncbi:hydrogenase nickel incorporation protein HypB [Candidatus Latescibacterota bacterium]